MQVVFECVCGVERVRLVVENLAAVLGVVWRAFFAVSAEVRSGLRESGGVSESMPIDRRVDWLVCGV